MAKLSPAEVAYMRCQICKTETPMLFACARCVRLYGQGCCCLKCNQLCQKLEAPVDKKISEVAEPDRPPTVH
jgi:hypothetical protein